VELARLVPAAQHQNDDTNESRTLLFETGSEFSPVVRSEIVGIDSIINQIDEITTWLTIPEEFAKFGARLEPGLLLEGSPGTGKTLCSRYIATSSDALFVNVRDFATSGDVVSAADIADLFSRARNYFTKTKRPVIIFWDEFEIFARERAEGKYSMRDASVVTQLTAELDGIGGKCPGVLFIGCTNYKRTIDPALLRPGRMGIHIHFVAPDQAGKAKLLEHYLLAHKSHLESGLDFESGAFFFNEEDTAAAVEEAAQKIWLRAVTQAIKNKFRPVVSQRLMNSVLLENLLGQAPPFQELRPDSEFAVAVHELGHAIVAKMLDVTIQVITIQPGRDSFGRVITKNVDPKIANVIDIQKQISVGLGSIAAECVVGIPNSAHAISDTKNATAMALRLVDELGQNHDVTGPMNIEALNERSMYVNGAISQELVSNFDRRLCNMMTKSYYIADEQLQDVGADMIRALANKLIEQKTWTGKQFDQVFKETEFDLLQMRRDGRNGQGHPTLYQTDLTRFVPSD
jgi:cell division protease FtsH